VTLDDKHDTTLVYYERARVHAERGGRAVIVTRRDPPHNGAKLLLFEQGAPEGTLGDAFLDQRFTEEARQALAAGKSRTLFLENVRAFAEVVTPPSTLLWSGPATSRCRCWPWPGRSATARRCSTGDLASPRASAFLTPTT
jgi:hypothetical protein